MSIADFLTKEIGKAVVHPFGDKNIQRGIILYSQGKIKSVAVEIF